MASSKKLSDESPLLAMGIIQLEQGNSSEAVETFRQALTFYSQNKDKQSAEPLALIYLARAFAAENELTLARDTFQLLADKYKDNELADNAMFELAHLEGKHLLTANEMIRVFNDFVFQDPLTIDFDALIYLPGYDKGYRLDGLDRGLTGLSNVWKNYPQGDKADDALLLEAYNRAFMLEQRDFGLNLLNKLIDEYPDSEHIPFAVLAKAFIHSAQQNFSEALTDASNVEPHSDAAPCASFLSGYIAAYQLKTSSDALTYFKAMEQLSDNELWKGASLYHQSMAHFVLTHNFKESNILALKAKEKLTPFSGDRATVMTAATQYIAETSSLISQEKDVYKARLIYALFFQGGGHPGFAAEEFRTLLKENIPADTKSRVQYELGIILQDDLGAPEKGVELLRECLMNGSISKDREEEARYRIARNAAKITGSSSKLRDIAKDTTPWSSSAAKELTKNHAFSAEDFSHLISNESPSKDTSSEYMAPVLKNLAQMFEREGNLKQALEYYGRLLSIWPGAIEAMAETEERLALVSLMNSISTGESSTPDDAPLLLSIGLLQKKMGNSKDARMYLRRAQKAAKNTSGEAAIAFELMKFEAENSRSPEHGLTIVNSFLKQYQGASREAVEALTIKASLLDTRLSALKNDPEQFEKIKAERDDILRYLINRGINVATAVETLARNFFEKKEFKRALEVLERANSLKPVPASILNLRAEVFS